MKTNLKIKPRKLAIKLTSWLIVGLIFAFTVLILAITNFTKTDLIARESEKLVLLAKENANITRESIETMIDKQDVIISAIQNLDKVDDENKVRYTTNLIDSVKSGQDNVLSIFFVSEPETFIADTPKGFSVFASESGTQVQKEQFKFIDEVLYNKAKTVKNLTVVDPFEKTIDGKKYKVITILQPVFDVRNNFMGLVGSNIDTEVINEAKFNNGNFESFSNQIICGHQTVIIHSTNPDAIGKKFVDITTSTQPEKILDSANNPNSFTLLDTLKSGKQEYRAFVPFYIGTSNVVWLSGTSISKAEFDAQILNQVIKMVVISIIGLVCLAIFSYLLIGSALKPIKALEKSAKEISKGNLKIEISNYSNDELGSLAESLKDSTETLSYYIQDIDRVMGEMSIGNFDVEPSRPFIGDFAHIETSIRSFVSNISSTIVRINQSSEYVSGGSEQVSDSADEMSEGSILQADAVERLSSTIGEISVQIDKNAKSAISATLRASEVGHEIDYSNKQMQEMTKAMERITNSSEEIGKIIKTINDIAFQTNILALNASLEASRAGEMGKGFAVVAENVRTLASKSSEAVKDTAVLIQTSIKAVQTGSRIASETATALENVVKGADEMVGIIDEIAKASGEQASSISNVKQDVNEISGVIRTNSAAAQESAATSKELSSQAHVLKELVKKFKLKNQG